MVVVTASPTAIHLDEEVLPLDAYTLTGEQYANLDYAVRLLAQACMKRFGIEWSPGGRVVPPNNGRNYSLGLVDPDQAATYGYHPTPEERASQDNSGDTAQNLTDYEAIVLAGVEPGAQSVPGVPEGGCFGEANRQLAWDREAESWLQLLSVQAMIWTLEHADTQAVNARWSACMQAGGYDYATPSDANNDPAWWQDSSAGPSEREINTAVADVRCKLESNYIGEVTAVLAAYQQSLVDANFERLESMRAGTVEALRRAADVLSSPPA